jgi:hypothetical protein
MLPFPIHPARRQPPCGPFPVQEFAMQGHSHLQRTAEASCLASARSWRKEAEHLRDNAEAAYLTAGQRATLLCEAEAAERQADWWLDAIALH